MCLLSLPCFVIDGLGRQPALCVANWTFKKVNLALSGKVSLAFFSNHLKAVWYKSGWSFSQLPVKYLPYHAYTALAFS
jgi:hypothetical protein